MPARAAPRRWWHSLGSSSRGKGRARCKQFGRDDGDDDDKDKDNNVVDDDSYGDAYSWVPIIAAVWQTKVTGWRNKPIT